MSDKNHKKSKPRPRPEKPSVTIETGEAADQAFLEAMQDFDPSWVPPGEPEAEERPSGRKRSAGAPSQSGKPDLVIDLHGFTLREALTVVHSRIASVLASASGIIHIRIITGKGRHSGEGGSVLAREVHAEVRARYQRRIQRLDEAPTDVVVGDLPIRGHFDVWLRS
jgi:DNA-nicking Smr family endonuclease